MEEGAHAAALFKELGHVRGIGDIEGHPALVGAAEFIARGIIVDIAFGVTSSGSLHPLRAFMIPAHTHVRDIAVMADPVHHLAAAEAHPPAPVPVEALWMIGNPLRGAHPRSRNPQNQGLLWPVMGNQRMIAIRQGDING